LKNFIHQFLLWSSFEFIWTELYIYTFMSLGHIPSRIYDTVISNIYIRSNDVRLYNRLTVFHEFHVLDKASKDKVMTESTSGVKFLLQLLAKRQWCRHSVSLIVLLSHISFPSWWRWRKFWKNVPATFAWKPMLVLSRVTWYVDEKRRWWWWYTTLWLKHIIISAMAFKITFIHFLNLPNIHIIKLHIMNFPLFLNFAEYHKYLLHN